MAPGKIDPSCGRTVGRLLPLGVRQPIAVAADYHVLWIAGYDSSTIRPGAPGRALPRTKERDPPDAVANAFSRR